MKTATKDLFATSWGVGPSVKYKAVNVMFTAVFNLHTNILHCCVLFE